jgi:hypothetical protein
MKQSKIQRLQETSFQHLQKKLTRAERRLDTARAKFDAAEERVLDAVTKRDKYGTCRSAEKFEDALKEYRRANARAKAWRKKVEVKGVAFVRERAIRFLGGLARMSEEDEQFLYH